MKILAISLFALLLVGCSDQDASAPEQPLAEAAPPAVEASRPSLPDILNAQPTEVKARYPYRHPEETLEFLGITPGMTVVEVLPSGGWYTKLLLPYLGAEGKLVGADYPRAIWPMFGSMSEEALSAKETWVVDWTAEAETWRTSGDAEVAGFVHGAMPESMRGTADAVLLIRALHNLSRFESEGGFLTQTIRDSYLALKPGGVAGVVQHHARDEMPDDWANGSNGYLKKDFIIVQMEKAGFEYVDASDINANPKDQPTESDFVWRLPPSLGTSGDNPELRAEMEAIGESNRMTLKFRKPVS
ncbi:MAG: methyltransferase [Gammaproteobacteria bacterium]|nr:methyltransferase [Gammaproteobacteria bacterium]